MRISLFDRRLAAGLILIAPLLPAHAEDSAELAKKLSNPVAALISVPLQFNYDRGIGPVHDGERLTMNIQPVVPITLNADWNVISHTILPVTHQSSLTPGSGTQTGLGDTLQSLFFSPRQPTAAGLEAVAMERADSRGHQQARQVQGSAGQLRLVRHVLGRGAGQRPARLGRARGGDLPVSQVMKGGAA